jgi:acyl carrier protein
MSIRSTVFLQIQEIARENGVEAPALIDELPLMDSGLDSLALAVLVARLEEVLGLDPFTEADDFPDVVTLGDFVRFYEKSAKSRDVDSPRVT